MALLRYAMRLPESSRYRLLSLMLSRHTIHVVIVHTIPINISSSLTPDAMFASREEERCARYAFADAAMMMRAARYAAGVMIGSSMRGSDDESAI